MDVFKIRNSLVGDYESFTTSFVTPRDSRIREHLDERVQSGAQWPDPWLSLNPFFQSGGSISELVSEGVLTEGCKPIFKVKNDLTDPGTRELVLHQHQRDAIESARTGSAYVLTTGTGSGKSLAYIVPIVDRVLRDRAANPQAPKSVKAFIVYPMNALANSQQEELKKFLTFGFGEGKEPVTYARYTGQEKDEERQRILANPPDILLTNYVMLELLLTRPQERKKLINAARGLQFFVLDELHTYRGRQGADVAMLVRRVREATESPNMQCVGTSATMASGGTIADQKATVAAVATRLFGSPVTPENVIGETLIRGTNGNELDVATLRHEVSTKRFSNDFAELAESPLATWVESTFGLTNDEVTGQLVRQRPTKVPKAAEVLAELTGEPSGACRVAIEAVLHAGSAARHPQTNRPLFAFRIHQFLSKGDNVYTSVHEPLKRFITGRYQLAVPNKPEQSLVPLVFCRECGQEYLSVALDEKDGERVYRTRADRDASAGDNAGYLYISDDFAWPEASDHVEYFDRLPDSWTTEDKNGNKVVIKSREKKLPRAIRVMPDGTQTEGKGTGVPVSEPVTTDAGVKAAYAPSPFTFCLRCGTSYESRGNEYARLASLTSEGRSSAMTILSTSLVRSLKQVDDPGFDQRARKLLTFVDNRQDASLQSGHVNDFLQVTQLRSALAQAVADAGAEGLATADIGSTVLDAMEISFEEFSKADNPLGSIRRRTEESMRSVIQYRLLNDLERGWRINMPNLEQVGLLIIDYLDREELAERADRWVGTHWALEAASPEVRAELLRIMLDELRRNLVIDAPLLTLAPFEAMRQSANQNLLDPWAMDISEAMSAVRTAYPIPAGGASKNSLYRFNLSGYGAFGRYLRTRSELVRNVNTTLNLDDSTEIIKDLLKVSAAAGLLVEVEPDQESDITGYRLNADVMQWKAGSGQNGTDDPIRRTIDDEAGARVNPFFLDLYKNPRDRLAGALAHEHTAQVPSKVREERERAFREGELAMLFCSPTMELGVDISSLNAVGMRNVPPTPANYAQRSGRAGRSGQPAIVVTYCATGSAHDSYYFKRSDQMVAGSVAAPRLDLANEELVRAHVHAVWLAEVSLDLKRSMNDILVTENEEGVAPSLAVRDSILQDLANEGAQRSATKKATQIVEAIADDLRGAVWFDEGWVERTIKQAPNQFDQACNRWRELYLSAFAQQRANNKIANDPSASKSARETAKRRREEAERQRDLLVNVDSDNVHGDFYPYRYFASEGFLPGYSFPRLPLAAFIPGKGSRYEGDYLQRARFLAVSEFGPGALIYHEGSRYIVDRIQLPPSDPSNPGQIETKSMRRCEECGYLHDREENVDDCAHCGRPLGASTDGMLQLRTVFTRRRERINSDEEERRRAGHELQLSFQFAARKGAGSGSVSAVAEASDVPQLELTYGDTATIRMANLGPRRRKPGENGYYLNTDNGKWLSAKEADRIEGTTDAELDDSGKVTRKARVIPYVEDTRNILITRLANSTNPSIATTLQYALERGIEAEFQLEDSELVSQQLPDASEQGRTIFMEANEGGAGVLRRLIEEPDALARVARAALQIAHFEPDGTDVLADAPDEERCEKACYDCLLSYSNQLDHPLIDRHAIRDLLLELANSRTKSDEARADSDRVAELKALCDSELEKQFLDFLIDHDYRLPDKAQELVEDAICRPDFTYVLPNGPVAVFIDGPHHEDAHTAEKDAQATQRLEDLGWPVVRISHTDNFAEKLAQYSSVFGQGR